MSWSSKTHGSSTSATRNWTYILHTIPPSKPSHGSSTSATRNWTYIHCTIPPSKQWKIRSLSQMPKTHPEVAMQKQSFKLGQVHKPSSGKLQSDTKPCHSWNTIFFLVYRRDPNLPLYQLLEPMQQFLRDPESGLINLQAHHLALAITKKTLDENCFRTAQKTTENHHHSE